MDTCKGFGPAQGTISERRGGDGTRTEARLAARAIPISRGRTIVVRPVRPWDEPGLAELYEGLGTEDRYLRFFCAYRPQLEFIRRLANPGPREARVVAELHEPTGTRLIAEAGYSWLANGNGEFAMVVARDWRGWLGPYLLDVVVGLAAANRVPNLEAEVLATNTRMLALLRARGCVVLRHDGWNEFRMMVGTGRHGPTWSDADDRPRVLVETPGGRWPLEGAADAAGMRVITCPGPTQNASCPLLSGQECPLVACADAIVVRNPAPDGRWDAIVHSHSFAHPDIPVVIDQSDAKARAVTIDDVRLPAFVHFYMATAQRSGTPESGA